LVLDGIIIINKNIGKKEKYLSLAAVGSGILLLVRLAALTCNKG
jgi:hypothetical protein